MGKFATSLNLFHRKDRPEKRKELAKENNCVLCAYFVCIVSDFKSGHKGHYADTKGHEGLINKI